MPHRTIHDALTPGRLVVLAVALALPLQGCSVLGSWRITAGASPYTEGSGTKTTVQRTVGTYHAISASAGVMVVVEPGTPGAVSVTADDNLIDQLTTEVVDETLYVGVRGGVRTNDELRVQVANSSLVSISATTGATVEAESVMGSSITISASTGGTVRAGGKVDSLHVASDTGGNADVGNIEAAQVDAAVSTGGTARVYPTESVTGACTGGGTLLIRGKPASNTVSTDSSSTTRDGQ